MASVWYFIPEIDPTPFLRRRTGSFRGLPSTFTGRGDAGFTFVTPMMVTSDLPTSAHDVRTVATLRIDFTTTNVPTRRAGVLAILLALGRRGAAEAPTREALSPLDSMVLEVDWALG